MTWAATKIFFKKSYVWCVQHWRWLIFGIVALMAYLAGRKNSRALWQQAELARKQYQKEASAIEKAHSDKNKKVKKAESDFKTDVEKAEKEKSREEKALEAKKRREMMRIVRDQDAMDRALKDSGIDEV